MQMPLPDLTTMVSDILVATSKQRGKPTRLTFWGSGDDLGFLLATSDYEHREPFEPSLEIVAVGSCRDVLEVVGGLWRTYCVT
jgi:hypothetical protein